MYYSLSILIQYVPKYKYLKQSVGKQRTTATYWNQRIVLKVEFSVVVMFLSLRDNFNLFFQYCRYAAVAENSKAYNFYNMVLGRTVHSELWLKRKL